VYSMYYSVCQLSIRAEQPAHLTLICLCFVI
jgi:hypothetical protein